MAFPHLRPLTPLALLLALPLGAQVRQLHPRPGRQHPAVTGSEPDRPDLRRDWNLYWFGGQPSPAYLDYKNHLAAREMRRWGNLMPKAGSSKLLPAIVGTAAAPSGTGGTWQPLGPLANSTSTQYPDIDSGRPSAIAVDPASNTLYLAASGGGVWRCTNADPNATGDWTWEPITDGLPNSGASGNVSVGALALSPTNTQTLYLGLGDAFDAEGRGFYLSTDGGNTWTASTGIGNQTISFFILPVDASVVLWGTNDGLKRSTDGGKTFIPVTSGPTSGNAWSIQAFSPTDLVCSASGGSIGADTNGTIYYSKDAGATWTQATISGLGSIVPGRMSLTAVPNGTTGYAEVEDTAAQDMGAGVLKTTDLGHTWSWVTPTTPPFKSYLADPSNPNDGPDGGQEWYNQAIAVDPTNANQLVMGANLAMYRSMDGGSTWQQLTHWYSYAHVYSHADFHTVTYKSGAFYVGNDGGLSIFKAPWGSIPTGTTQLPSNTSFVDNTRNKGLATHLVYNVGSTLATNVSDGQYRISLGMQDNGTRIRQPNAGNTTLTGAETTFDDMIGGDGFATLINPADGTQMLGSVYFTDIYKSKDGGAHFSESITGLTGAGDKTKAPFQPRLAQGDSAHPNTVYTATNYTIFQSTNFGGTWTALPTTGLPTALIRNVGAAYGDSQALGVVTNGGLVSLSYNGGSSWTQHSGLPGNALNNSYVWFDRANSSIVYAASVALVPTANHLWKSTDRGTSWTAIDGNGFPFGIPVHVVQTDPKDPNTIYAGTDFGVYYSVDGGSTWSRFGSGLPMVAVRDLYIAPDDSFIRAATFGRGVWQIQPSSAPASLSVAIAPTGVTLINGGTQSFTPTVTGGTANTVTWASANGGTVPTTATLSGTAEPYTAPATGTSDTVTVTTVDTPVSTAQATVTLVAPSAVTVAVSPSAAELLAGSTATQTFTAAVSPLTNQSVTWSASGGTITTGGVFSASGLAAGTYTVSATSQGSPTSTPGTATVTLVSPSAVTVTVAPASGSTATTVSGSTIQFQAAVTGLSLPADQAVTWTVTGGGSISPTGLFTATAPPAGPTASFTVTATSTFDPNVSGSATVTIKSLDLNVDSTVDLRDLLTFAQFYGTKNATCDLNGDGVVDDKDLTLLLGGL